MTKPITSTPIRSTIVSLREANQGFARYVRAAEAGQAFVITRNGTPVARLAPVGRGRELTAEQRAALARTHARMERRWQLEAGPIDRDALHER
jgi:prevent-host-death family protein